MNTLKQDTKTINKLIAICNDGEEFYLDAMKQVELVSIKTLFGEMAKVRAEISNNLARDVELVGEEPEDSGTLTGSLRQAYTNIKKHLTTKSDTAVLIEQLEETEDRTLEYFQKAVNDIDDHTMLNNVRSGLRSIQLTHDKMKELKLHMA